MGRLSGIGNVLANGPKDRGFKPSPVHLCNLGVNIVTSHAAGPGSIPGRIIFPVWDFGGPCGSNGKALGYALDGPGSIPAVGGVEIFLHFFVSRLVLASTELPTKWVPEAFSGIKAAERKTSPTSY